MSPPARTIRIGVDLPTTGNEARAAVPALNGIRFFVQTHPTLDGFGVDLTVADDAGGGFPNPSHGASNVRGFLADSSLVAMIGPFDAGVARKEIPIANEAGLAMISPATSSPCLTRDVFMPAKLNPAQTEIGCKTAGLPPASDLRPAHTNNFFRLSATDDLQGAAAADYAFSTLHVLRAGVISDHEAYGQGLVDAFSARLASLGGTVLGHLDLDPKNPDATVFLLSMKEANAQAIYYGGPSRMGGCNIRAQMRTQFGAGAATPFLGGDGIAEDPACVRSAGGNGAGIFATVPIIDARLESARNPRTFDAPWEGLGKPPPASSATVRSTPKPSSVGWVWTKNRMPLSAGTAARASFPVVGRSTPIRIVLAGGDMDVPPMHAFATTTRTSVPSATRRLTSERMTPAVHVHHSVYSASF